MAATHPLLGKELGNYVVRSLIGEGGMGAVFSGEHRFLGTRVAIKVLHGSYANNPVVTQRFFQEAKSSLEIDHPNIIKILDLGQSADGALYLVMELLEGRSLGQAIAEGTFGEGAAARIGSFIADGLAAAHAKGIVHRDLKPDNVFLTGDQVKVLDFGIAKVVHSTSATKTGSLLGTPQYMAPEQAKGSKHVGPHTDVYALGAMLFEMVTGRPPFEGEDLPELLAKQLFEPPPSPRTLAPISPEMEEIILQCLEKDPTLRPADMIELRDRLKKRIGVPTGLNRTGPQRIAPTMMPDGPLARPPTPPHGTARPTSSRPATPRLATPAPADAADAADANGAAGRPQARPYVPTYTPNSTIAGAASEVVSVEEPARLTGGGISKGWWIGAAAAAVLAIGVGVAVTRKPDTTPLGQAVVVTTPTVVTPTAAGAAAELPAAAAAAPPKQVVAAPAALPLPQKVTVRTDPEGAIINIDGHASGETPKVLSLALPQEIFVSLKGYKVAHEVLSQPGEVTIRMTPEVRARPKAPAKPTVDKERDKGDKDKAQPAAPRFREGLD